MGLVIVIVCVGAGLNLALWCALYVRLDGLPLRIWSMARRERTEGDGPALTLLQEGTAAKVGSIVKSLRDHEEHVAASFRAQVADAEVRARVAERQSSEAGVALSAAVGLVRELRQVLDGERWGARAPSRSASTLPEGRETVAMEPEAVDTARKPGNPEPASRERPSPRTGLVSGIAPTPKDEGARLSEDELTQVVSRPLSGVLDAGKTLVSPAGKEGVR